MTAITSFSTFHQWLLAESAPPATACAIIIHTDSSWSSGFLIDQITEYLNEYDDEGDGCWLPATHELVARVSADANYRHLLGIPEHAPDGPEGIVETLAALGQRGRVVFHAPETSDLELGQTRPFHAGVGQTSSDFTNCHLILNPALIDPKSIVHIIGDVFLEWLHRDFRSGTMLHQIE